MSYSVEVSRICSPDQKSVCLQQKSNISCRLWDEVGCPPASLDHLQVQYVSLGRYTQFVPLLLVIWLERIRSFQDCILLGFFVLSTLWSYLLSWLVLIEAFLSHVYLRCNTCNMIALYPRFAWFWKWCICILVDCRRLIGRE